MVTNKPATDTAADTRPRRGRLRRWAVRAAWTGGILVVGWSVFAIWVERACIYAPPPLPPAGTVRAEPVAAEADGTTRAGACWFHADEGISELYLEGGPVQRGEATASLCGALHDRQEAQLLSELDRMLPAGPRRHVVRKGLLFAFRDLPGYIAQEYQVEAAAMARVFAAGPRRPMDDEFPVYHRVLFYQSLYDTGQAMAEAGLVDVDAGCTSFAAAGPLTSGGGLVVARNCDFEAGNVFDDAKVVQFVRADGATPYVAVAWAGMLGVVSGVNRDGLVVMLHAGRTEASKWPRPGRPVPMILRDALAADRTIEDVAERFRTSPTHAAAIVLVAETGSGRSAIIETDPARTVVVRPGSGATVVANHMTSREWDGDTVVAAARSQGTSALRLARMQELVEASAGRIDVASAGAILRDRRGAGGAEIGTGNRTSISALIVAHAVVVDGATRTLHVARAPRGLGEFVAYDLARFFDGAAPRGPADVRAAGAPSIPAAADARRASEVDRARRLMRDAGDARSDGRTADAITLSTEAAGLMDRAPEALLALAESLHAAGDVAGAARVATEALTRQPAPGNELLRLRSLATPPGR